MVATEQAPPMGLSPIGTSASIAAQAPSIHRRYPASSVLRAPPPSHTAWPVSRELPVDPRRDHRWDFPCCAWSPLRTCHRQYPGRSDGTCSLVQFHSLRPSHETGAGRLLHHYFRGLLSVHSRYGLQARRVALATLCTRGFSSLVASTAALIATGWSEPVPGRVYPRCGPAPSRRTRLARQSPAISGKLPASMEGVPLDTARSRSTRWIWAVRQLQLEPDGGG
jgi:hypothetical protein